MTTDVKFKFDQETGIFYKYYSGKVYFENLISSWENIIKNKTLPKGVKKFIIDYTDSIIMFNHEKAAEIASFYKNHDEVFSNAKIAMIMGTPEQVIFPLLVRYEKVNFVVKTFSTLEAASDWILE